jgi:hypothetical protein
MSVITVRRSSHLSLRRLLVVAASFRRIFFRFVIIGDVIAERTKASLKEASLLFDFP